MKEAKPIALISINRGGLSVEEYIETYRTLKRRLPDYRVLVYCMEDLTKDALEIKVVNGDNITNEQYDDLVKLIKNSSKLA